MQRKSIREKSNCSDKNIFPPLCQNLSLKQVHYSKINHLILPTSCKLALVCQPSGGFFIDENKSSPLPRKGFLTETISCEIFLRDYPQT